MACAGSFKWLESKTYKMHVRVLLSRYRAYTTCPSCHGGRFQPETLNYRIEGSASFQLASGEKSKLEACATLPALAALPVGRVERTTRPASRFRLTTQPR